MTLQEAYKLAKQTEYAHDAVIMEGECECGRKVYNSINWADASAFFLEGYEYALKHPDKAPEGK